MDVPLPEVEYRRDLTIRAAVAEFTAVADMEVGRDGTMYVLDRGAQTVVMFDSRGKRIRSFGRSGEGPGEFRGAGKLAIRGDSLWVVDHALRRVTRFSLNGADPKSFLINPSLKGVSSPAGIGERGVLVAVNTTHGATKRLLGSQSELLIVRTDFEGKVSDTVVSLRDANAVLRYNIYPADQKSGRIVGNIKAQQPFSSRAYWSSNSDGSGLVVMREKMQGLPAAAGAISVATITLAGDTVQQRTLHYKREPLTAKHVNGVVDSLSRPFTMKGNVQVRGDRRLIRDSLHIPAFWPAFSALLVGRDGSIWIKRNGALSDTSSSYWVLFSGQEKPQSVTLPAGFILLRASESTLWGWTRDEDGLPIVERLRAVQTR